MPLADLLAWRPRIRREPDPREGELSHAGGDLREPAATAERDARRIWGLCRRLRWTLGRRR